MNSDNYNYAIEKYLAERGGKADKDITRTCGNCESYDAEHWQCLCADEEEGTFRKKKDAGCYYHRTHEENERLKMLVKQRQDETNRLRLDEQRRNGTGDCAGCPFRKEANTPTTNFKRITRSPHALAMLFARKMDIPIRCHFCAKKTCHAASHRENYEYCQQHIKEWLEKEQK